MTDNKRIPVLWFGTGSMTENLLSAVDYTKVQILAFIDERKAMRGTLFSGLPVIDLEHIHDYAFDCILVGARNFAGIKEKLIHAGVPCNKIHSLDFENDARAVALHTASFQACLNSVLNSAQPVYRLFHDQSLLQTAWLRRVSEAWSDSLGTLGMPDHEIRKNKNIVSIAVRLNFTVGDTIISLAWLKELYKQAQYKLQIDLFAFYDYTRHIFYNQQYINAVYPEHLYTAAKNYTFKLFVGNFVRIESYPTVGERLHPQLQEQIDKISAFVQRYNKFNNNKYFIAWTSFCALQKWNRWDQVGANQAIDFSRDNGLGLDLQPEAFSILERYGLDSTPFITLHAGGHVWHYSDGIGTKIWPQHRWSEFCRQFKQAHPEILLVQVGDNHSFVMEGVDFCLLGKTTQEETTVLLKQAVLHIDGESGLVHTRRQLSGRSVVLFGPTPVDFFGYAQNVNIVSPLCSNCLWLTDDWFTQCPKGLETPECMPAISAECVFKAVSSCLSQTQSFAYHQESLALYSTSGRINYEPVVEDICKLCGMEQKPITEHIYGEEGIYLRSSKQWEYPFALEWIANMREENGPLHIADVGGGRGALAWYLAQKGHQVAVYDPDYSQGSNDKDLNRRYMQFAKRQGYVAEFGSAFNIPEEDGCFNVVLSISVVEHLPHKLYALKEMLRVLKPGGRLIITYDLTLKKHNDAIRIEVFTPLLLRETLKQLNISRPVSHLHRAVLASLRDIRTDQIRLPEGMTVGGFVITKQHRT